MIRRCTYWMLQTCTIWIQKSKMLAAVRHFMPYISKQFQVFHSFQGNFPHSTMSGSVVSYWKFLQTCRGRNENMNMENFCGVKLLVEMLDRFYMLPLFFFHQKYILLLQFLLKNFLIKLLWSEKSFYFKYLW